GLLQMQPWARKLSIAYGVTSILHKLASGIYTILFLMPITMQWFATFVAQQPAPNPAAQAAQAKAMAFTETLMKGSMVATPFISMIYPAIVLFVMGRRETQEAFQEDVPDTPPAD